MVLVVLDASHPAADEEARERDAELVDLAAQRLTVVAQNKIDIANNPAPLPVALTLPAVQTSAITGQGIAELRTEILRLLGGDAGVQQESGFLTNVRQQRLVEDAIAALDQAAGAVPMKTPHEMVLLDLYGALRPLDDITGATTADDILTLIFSSFCIGK